MSVFVCTPSVRQPPRCDIVFCVNFSKCVWFTVCVCLYSVCASTTDDVGDDYDDRDDDGDADDGDTDDDHGVSEGQARLLGGVTALPELSCAQNHCPS